MRMARPLAILCLASAAGLACGGGAAAPSAVQTQGPPLNPKLADGRVVYRTFDDHHPECFAFVGATRDTETVECPAGALDVLASCPGGRLYKSRGTTDCVCVLEDGSSETARCPAQ